jgi:CDP-2,3-bis-(O-geranylgeranyl)-sn-glycerol synthase
MSETFAELLLMLLASNGMPVLAARIFRSNGALPVDLGLQLPDGRALFGPSKTWRGVILAVLAAALLGAWFGYGLGFGAIFGMLAMLGDLFSSLVKRRMGLKPSARCTGLDQMPESLIPSLYAGSVLGFEWWWSILLALAFTLVGILISGPLYRLRIRKRPH